MSLPLDAPFAGGVTYRAKVTAGLQDVSGALLAEDYVWEFTIAPPGDCVGTAL